MKRKYTCRQTFELPWWWSCLNATILKAAQMFQMFTGEDYSWCSAYRSHMTISMIFFLFVWIKYLLNTLFFKSTVYGYLLWYYLQIWSSRTIFTRTFQYGLEVSFRNQKPISGSHVFNLLIQLNEKFKTPFLSLKNIGRKYTAWFSMALLQSSTGYQSNVLFELRAPARDLAHIYSQDF